MAASFFAPSPPACIFLHLQVQLGEWRPLRPRHNVSEGRHVGLFCDSFLITRPCPLLFSSHISLPARVREMCVSEAPKEGAETVP